MGLSWGILRPKSKKNEWLFAFVLFTIVSFLYMGGVTPFNCTTTFVGLPGDSSGGLAWFQWADGNDPVWDYSHASNFPDGESLRRPQFITSYAQFGVYWLFSILTNQICGLNLMVLLGYLTGSLVMFGFLRWLKMPFHIALFGAFAATFVPYTVIKAGGHIPYMFNAIFTGIIWAYFAYIRSNHYKPLLIMACIAVYSMYFDGYYILITGALLAVLFLLTILQFFVGVSLTEKKLWIKQNSFRNFMRVHAKNITLVCILCLLLITPLAYIYKEQGTEIQGTLNSVRAPIQVEAQLYGTRLGDFLYPSAYHPLASFEYKEWRSKHIHGANLGENTLYIGYVIIALAVYAVIFAIRHRKRKIITHESRYVILACIAIILVLGSLSLPPVVNVFGINLSSPSEILISMTAKWRVLSRFFIVIHLAWVVLAVYGLRFLLEMRNRRLGMALTILAFVALFIEFAPPFKDASWSLVNDSPEVYNKVHNDISVDLVAEYPVTDHPSETLPFTFTFQQISNKPILNANDALTTGHFLRQSIAGINDKQTIPVLRGLGVDVIIVYKVPVDNPSLSVYQPPDRKLDLLIGRLYAYKINPGESANEAAVFREGFILDINKDNNRSSMLLSNKGVFTIDAVRKKSSEPINDDSVSTLDFKLGAYTQGEIHRVRMFQNDQAIFDSMIGSEANYSLEVKDNSPIQVRIDGSNVNPVIRISDAIVRR